MHVHWNSNKISIPCTDSSCLKNQVLLPNLQAWRTCVLNCLLLPQSYKGVSNSSLQHPFNQTPTQTTFSLHRPIYLNSSGPPKTVNMICSGWEPCPEYATVCQPVHIPQKHFRAVFIECKTQPLVRNMTLLGSTCGEAGKRLFLLMLNAGVLWFFSMWWAIYAGYNGDKKYGRHQQIRQMWNSSLC